MTPNKAEVPTAVAPARDFEVQTKTDSANCANLRAERKALSTLVAKFAIKGFELELRPDRTLAAHRWGLTRNLANVDAAEQFLAQIGGAQ